jgi:hypothetical protein
MLSFLVADPDTVHIRILITDPDPNESGYHLDPDRYNVVVPGRVTYPNSYSHYFGMLDPGSGLD